MTLPVVVDVETTGLDSQVDGVVQIGFAWRGRDGKIRTRGWLCNPGEQYYADGRADIAFQINGLSPEIVSAAEPISKVALRVKWLLAALKAHYGSIRIYAYNSSFDNGFLSLSPWTLGREAWGRCLMFWAIDVWNPGGKWLKLVEAVTFLIEPIPAEIRERAHGAPQDAYMALRVLEELQEDGGVVD